MVVYSAPTPLDTHGHGKLQRTSSYVRICDISKTIRSVSTEILPLRRSLPLAPRGNLKKDAINTKNGYKCSAAFLPFPRRRVRTGERSFKIIQPVPLR